MTGQPKRRVALIGTGGTISSIGRDSLDVWEYMDTGQKIGPDDLVARYPEIAQVAEIVPVPFRSVGSTSIGPADWLLLAETIHTVAAREAPLDGVVITHGTATLEETAYFLNLAVHVDVTVVVVGAQRPASGLSSDAGMNLVGALRVAAAPEARGLGALVVLNDEIQAAREVTKTSTLRLETFRSADLGMLGYADPDGRVAIYRRPTRRHAPGTEFDVRERRDLPRVDIAYSYAGADRAAVDAFVAAGARAIVSASLAPGVTTSRRPMPSSTRGGGACWSCCPAVPVADACSRAPCCASGASSPPTTSCPRRRGSWPCWPSRERTIRSRSSACSTSTDAEATMAGAALVRTELGRGRRVTLRLGAPCLGAPRAGSGQGESG